MHRALIFVSSSTGCLASSLSRGQVPHVTTAVCSVGSSLRLHVGHSISRRSKSIQALLQTVLQGSDCILAAAFNSTTKDQFQKNGKPANLMRCNSCRADPSQREHLATSQLLALDCRATSGVLKFRTSRGLLEGGYQLQVRRGSDVDGPPRPGKHSSNILAPHCVRGPSCTPTRARSTLYRCPDKAFHNLKKACNPEYLRIIHVQPLKV